MINNNEYTTKYLRITVHDNDFTTDLIDVAEILYKIFQNKGRYPKEDELDLLKEYVEHLWYAIHNIRSIMSRNESCVGFTHSDIGLFEHKLEFVYCQDIPDDDDYKSIYIPYV